MKREIILQKVKATVQQIDPQAEVILFGSRARGDAREDSDWDFLVLTDYQLNDKGKYALVDTVFEQVELTTGEVTTLILHEKAEWYTKFKVTPLGSVSKVLICYICTKKHDTPRTNYLS